MSRDVWRVLLGSTFKLKALAIVQEIFSEDGYDVVPQDHSTARRLAPPSHLVSSHLDHNGQVQERQTYLYKRDQLCSVFWPVCLIEVYVRSILKVGLSSLGCSKPTAESRRLKHTLL